MGSDLDIFTEYFGLTERPFALQPDPDFLFWSPAHQHAFTMLEYGVLSQAPITVVTGEIGAGKTTLLRHLLRQLGSEYTIGLVSNAQGNRGELLHWIFLALGLEFEQDAGYVALFAKFQDFLIQEYEAGRRTILIFDEAQNLNVETLEELRMYSNINADKDALLQLILVGQPELRDVITGPGLTQFAQRVASDYHIPAMPADVVKSYIRHRLEVAGGDPMLFTDGACEAVHAAAGGLPRRVNQLCDYALVYAYGAGATEIDRATVDQVVADRVSHGTFTGGAVSGDVVSISKPPKKKEDPQPNRRKPPTKSGPRPRIVLRGETKKGKR